MLDYLSFWKLTRPPFDAGADPEFFFESRMHGEALARLEYFAADQSMGLAAITGEIGAGKTMTLQVFMRRLRPDVFRSMMIFTAPESPAGLLAEINRQLGGGEPVAGAPADRDGLTREFQKLLREKLVASGRKLLIVLDEAQLMDEACIDAVKCLTNPIAPGVSPVSVILSGQPELKAKLRALPQVYQRFGLIYHLGYLARDEVPDYVRHRLAVSQASSTEVFDDTGFDLLYRFSNGCPRQINQICKLAVDRACLLQQPSVDDTMLQMIISDFEKHFA
jgi:type II secretory pathway predicted ATPase ExeA